MVSGEYMSAKAKAFSFILQEQEFGWVALEGVDIILTICHNKN